jgi:hypothetical protein
MWRWSILCSTGVNVDVVVVVGNTEEATTGGGTVLVDFIVVDDDDNDANVLPREVCAFCRRA